MPEGTPNVNDIKKMPPKPPAEALLHRVKSEKAKQTPANEAADNPISRLSSGELKTLSALAKKRIDAEQAAADQQEAERESNRKSGVQSDKIFVDWSAQEKKSGPPPIPDAARRKPEAEQEQAA